MPADQHTATTYRAQLGTHGDIEQPGSDDHCRVGLPVPHREASVQDLDPDTRPDGPAAHIGRLHVKALHLDVPGTHLIVGDEQYLSKHDHVAQG
ncbi:MAG: hypothetical protein ACRDN0_29605 [Trebonia sp.]